jgi:hypothetical protein
LPQAGLAQALLAALAQIPQHKGVMMQQLAQQQLRRLQQQLTMMAQLAMQMLHVWTAAAQELL